MKISTTHGCIEMLFLISQLTHGKSTGSICGSFQIMSARIHQKKALRFNRNIALLRGRIMDNGSMTAISTDRCKALLHIVFLLCPSRLQIICCRQLGHGFLARRGLQPVHESGKCHALFSMSLSKILDLCLIFDSLQKFRRIGLIQNLHICGNTGQQCTVYILLIQQHPFPSRQLRQILIDCFIRTDLHLTRRKILLNLIGHHRRTYIPDAVVLGHPKK